MARLKTGMLESTTQHQAPKQLASIVRDVSFTEMAPTARNWDPAALMIAFWSSSTCSGCLASILSCMLGGCAPGGSFRLTQQTRVFVPGVVERHRPPHSIQVMRNHRSTGRRLDTGRLLPGSCSTKTHHVAAAARQTAQGETALPMLTNCNQGVRSIHQQCQLL
jgi:hypothetical protein